MGVSEDNKKTIENLIKLRNWNCRQSADYQAKAMSFTIAAQRYQDRIMNLVMEEEKDQ